jgi:hypothetical protein
MVLAQSCARALPAIVSEHLLFEPEEFQWRPKK